MSLTVTVSDEAIGLAVEAVIVLGLAFLFLRHAYRMYRGTEVRVRSLVAWSVLYAILASTTVVDTILPFPSGDQAVIVFLAAFDTACAVIAGVWTYRRVERTTSFEWRAPGTLFYRMRPFVPVLYAVLFLTEIGIELATLGVTIPDEGSSPDLLPVLLRGILRLADVALSVCAGIIIGASVAIYAELRRRRATSAPTAAAEGVD